MLELFDSQGLVSRAVPDSVHVRAKKWAPGDPDITIVMEAGYDVIRLAWVPVTVRLGLVPFLWWAGRLCASLVARTLPAS